VGASSPPAAHRWGAPGRSPVNQGKCLVMHFETCRLGFFMRAWALDERLSHGLCMSEQWEVFELPVPVKPPYRRGLAATASALCAGTQHWMRCARQHPNDTHGATLAP
jgi:hypothetical protein